MKVSLVVPCYNEEEMLPLTVSELTRFLDGCVEDKLIDSGSEIIFVDDGSRDSTWQLIAEASEKHARVTGVKLSRNRGHQNALLAGMEVADGDFIITIDADLQDDVNVIRDMVKAAEGGAEIVLGVRRRRNTDSFFKRFSAQAFYRFMRMFKVDLVYNHADFRGMSKRAVNCLREYSEVNLFLRGIVPELGYSTMLVYYDRKERAAGETKYPLGKMLAFAWQGITSFSTIPLKCLTYGGLLLSFVSLLIVVWALVVRLFTDNTVPGWTSTLVPLIFLSGIQLMGMGIIGEYLGKIYLETKRRPRFFIEKISGGIGCNGREPR